MKAVYAPQGLLHHGQGKWYPGEPLPRWQIAVHWRLDGRPLWRDRALLADPWGPAAESAAAKTARAAKTPTTAVTPATAKRFIESVAASFDLPESQVRPAFEDPLAELSTNVRLPDGEPVTDDLDPEQDSPDARAEILARLDGAVTDATGSCCGPATRPRACGCRWTRSPGSRRRSSQTSTRSPPAAQPPVGAGPA